MDNQEFINVIVEGEKFQVSPKFAQISEYMQGLQALGFEDDEDIQVDSVSKQTFQQILSFYELCSYEEVLIKTPIKSNDLLDALSSVYVDFIQKHDILSEQFKNLVKACEFLGCKNLHRICAARFACLLYFKDSKQALQQKCKQLKIDVKVTFEDNEKFKRIYPFMNN